MTEAMKEELQDWLHYSEAHPAPDKAAIDWALSLLHRVAIENGLDD